MHSSILLPLFFLSNFFPLLFAASIPSLPFQTPHYVNSRAAPRSVFNKFRNLIIQTVWEVPPHHRDCQSKSKLKFTKTEPSKPQSLLARYGGDVVLRFNITSQEEAKALAGAANILFLDVWEYNTEWADIRLAKDVVRYFMASNDKEIC